jgi:hypothetical protein
MPTEFDYLLDKVRSAPFEEEPFQHLEIQNFLSEEHFHALTHEPQLDLPASRDAGDLIDRLERTGYTIIPFPGCVTSRREYLAWLEEKRESRIHAATESSGIVLRLTDYRSDLLKRFNAFLTSTQFQAMLSEKFGIDGQVQIDAGLQKYLHGYEISPHPDIRRKALTWMLNLNPAQNSESLGFHTHYLRLKPQWRFVTEFWKGNPDIDRDWLPWSWCETVKQQCANNSIVIFSPADDTLHAVKADYDHLTTQRTQFYGNLWYPARKLAKVDFGEFEFGGRAQKRHVQKQRRTQVIDAMKTTQLGKHAVSLLDVLRHRHVDTVRNVKA